MLKNVVYEGNVYYGWVYIISWDLLKWDWWCGFYSVFLRVSSFFVGIDVVIYM